MHWNRSTYFALSIGMMADGVMGAQTPVVSGDAAPVQNAPAPHNPFSG
jgi:membrane-bound lytic murein transglycosylase B